MTTATQPRPRISELARYYRYPRTAAELIKLRRDQMEELGDYEPHVCPASGEHGAMLPRPLERQTCESLYCGLWWDCQHCTSSSCQPSRDLAYDHGEPYDTGHGWEKFDGTGWAPIGSEEADAFYAGLAAWRESQRPKPRRRRVTARED